MPTLIKAKDCLPRKLRRRLDAPDELWATQTASATHYDSRRVLDRLNAIASARGAAPQMARFPTRPNKSSASEWWLDPVIWDAETTTICAWSDYDGTDLFVAAWGKDSESLIAELELFLTDFE